MAHFLDVIVTVNGFQHGEDEFTLKAMAAVAPSVAFQWLNVYHTAFLEDRLWGHLQTYRTQAHYHGLAIGTAGAAQYLAPDICAGLCAKYSQRISNKDVSHLHQSGSGPRASPTRVLSRCYSHNKRLKLGT